MNAENEAVFDYRGLLEHLPATAVAVFDHDLRLTLFRGPVRGLLPEGGGQLEGRLIRELLPEPEASALAAHCHAVLAGETRSVDWRSGPEGRAVALRLMPLRDDSGRVIAGMAVSIDVTDEARELAGLRDSESRLRQVFDEAPIGTALLTADGRFIKVNRALCELTGYEPARLLERSLIGMAHPEERRAQEAVLARVAGGEGSGHRGECRCLHASGQFLHVSLHMTAVRGADGSVEFLLAQMLDISERKTLEHRLQHLADHDPLTGLLNRRGFELELERQIATVRRYGDEGALLVLDLDQFKWVNDALGHRAGDDMIVSVARILRARLRETDVLGRLGGDEFAVLLPRANARQARQVAGALIESVRIETTTKSGPGANPRATTASVGIALFGAADIVAADALMCADLAMYDAKAAGGDRLSFYSSATRAEPQMKTRLELVERIRVALRDGTLMLHAQPIVDLHSGRVAIHKLLLRMTSETGAIVAPSSFLAGADRSDLAQEVDRWVVTRAIELASRGGQSGAELPVAIDISSKSLADPRLLPLVTELLAAHALDPARLIFEVAETEALGDLEVAQHFARSVQALGCRLTLADFGSGFGGFHFVKHLPFDLLKIDGGFVADCLLDRADQVIVDATVQIARGLGKLTIAQQAPNRATLDFLRARGVDFHQSAVTSRASEAIPAPSGRAAGALLSASPAAIL